MYSTSFGWTGSPGEYEVVGGAISFRHGNNSNRDTPSGYFNYYWVDDHINVVADVGSNCVDVERSLRYAMTAILGWGAVNEDKFTTWGRCVGSVAETVSMPPPPPPPRLPRRVCNLPILARSRGRNTARSWEASVT